MAIDEMDELVREFLIESQENIDRLDRELLTLEENPESADAIASIFRGLHTIKGTCGFLGYDKLEAVAHAGESLLSRLRDREIRFTTDMATALLKTVDAIREMLAAIEATSTDGAKDYPDLVALLSRVQEPATAAELVPELAQTPEPDNAQHAAADGTEPRTGGSPSSESEPRSPGLSEAYVRVDVGLLDKLMNLVGELVLARNQIVQFVSVLEDQAFSATTQRLNLITTELQSGVMKTRMQPIGNVWEKVPRLVRDLCHGLGKQVRVEMEGRDTELDKTIIEAIKDPLTHLVRNCVDHGIEVPADRVASGKRPEGRLFLRAFHEGGQVNIEISDDGAGLNIARLRAKAVEKGLATPDQVARMSDREAQNLIFLPGFSTAEKLSNISGRGVGMDVVKTNIEKIGGVVDLQTAAGEGTTFRIKIPLTLAIIPALVVSTGGERYAIPQISLLELLRLDGEQARSAIENAHGAAVYRLRGSLLPLVDLNRELGLEPTGRSAEGAATNVVVVQAEGRRFGLVVDHINDTEEIVVKPLGKHLKGIAAFAGATILGDGRVALILDVLGLAQRAHVINESRSKTAMAREASEMAASQSKTTLLLFGTSDGRRVGIPLSMVARLEVFERASIESVGDGQVVQYRDEILPLVNADDLLGGSPHVDAAQLSSRVHVVVHNVQGTQVGLTVGKIIDIVEEQLDVKPAAANRASAGITGCAVIHHKVTELLDVGALIRATRPGLLPAMTVLGGQ